MFGRFLSKNIVLLAVVGAIWSGTIMAADVTTGNSSVGGDASADVDIDYATTPVNVNAGGLWTGVLFDLDGDTTAETKAVVYNGGDTAGDIKILDGSEVQEVSLSGAAKNIDDTDATIKINGGATMATSLFVGAADADDDDINFGVNYKVFEDWLPANAFYVNIDGGTVTDNSGVGTNGAIENITGTLDTVISICDGQVTGAITGGAEIDILNVCSEVEQGDGAPSTTSITGAINLGAGENAFLIEAMTDDTQAAQTEITGDISADANADGLELCAEATNNGNAAVTVTGNINLDGGNNMIDICTMTGTGTGTASILVGGSITLGNENDDVYLVTEFDQDTGFAQSSIQIKGNINLGNGNNTVLLGGEGDGVLSTIQLTDSNASGTIFDIDGGTGNDTFYIYGANVVGNIDLNTASGGTDVINMVDSTVFADPITAAGIIKFGSTGGTLNIAGTNTVEFFELNGATSINMLANDAAYIASGANYADNAVGATFEVHDTISGAGTLSIGNGVTVETDEFGAAVDLQLADTAMVNIDGDGSNNPPDSSLGGVSGTGTLNFEDVDLTMNRDGSFSGTLNGGTDSATGGKLTIAAGTFTYTGTSLDVTRGIEVSGGAGFATNTAGIGDEAVDLKNGSTLASASGALASSHVTLADAGGSYIIDTSGGDVTLTGIELNGNMNLDQNGDNILTFVDLSETVAGDTLTLADESTIRLVASDANANTAGDMDGNTIAALGGTSATVIIEDSAYNDDIDNTNVSILRAGDALGTYDSTSNTTTVAGNTDLTGSGLATTDGGTVDLTGGTTTLSGTSNLDGGGTVSIGNTALTGDSTLNLANGTTASLNGTVTGAANITLGGTGTLRVTGSTVLPGNITVGADSTLALDHDAVGGDLALGDGATVEALADVELDEDISPIGGGIANIAGTGTISTSGALAVTDNDAGTINTAAGSGLTAANLTGSTGTLNVTGSGTVALGSGTANTGTASTYTGDINLNGGNLVLNLDLNGGVDVTVNNADATLSGGGDITGNVTVNGGTHAPGNSIAVVDYTGNYTVGNGDATVATIEIEVDNSGNSDRINATGAMTFDSDARFYVTGEDGMRITSDQTGLVAFAWDTNDDGDILSVDNTSGTTYTSGANTVEEINAALATLEDSSAVLDFTLYVTTASLTDEQILLDVTRSATYAEFGGSSNTSGIGRIFDSYSGGNAGVQQMLGRLDNLNQNQLAEALNQLSPESVMGAVDAAMGVNSAFTGQQSGRTGSFRQMAWNGGAAPAGPAGPAGMEDGLTVWANPFGTWGDQDSRNGFMGYEWDTCGVVVGIEKQMSDSLLAGLSFGYSNTDVEADEFSESEIDAYSFGAYATWVSGGFYLDGGLTYGYNDIESSRSIAFMSETAKGDTDADVYGIYTEAGYRFDLGVDWSVTPFAGLAYAYYDQDGYSESGTTGSNLSYDDLDQDSCVSTLGLRGRYEVNRDFAVKASARWMHEFCDNQSVATASFAGSSSFETKGLEPDDDSFVIGFGVDGNVAENVTLGVDYNYEFKDEYSAHNLSAMLKFEF